MSKSSRSPKPRPVQSYHDGFDLLQFIDKKTLTDLLEPYCTLTDLAGGVVRMPEDPNNPPRAQREIAAFRLTNPAVINPKSFCLSIRSCTEGDKQCMWSDLKDARRAYQKGGAVHYSCHMGLTDIVAPIKVAGRHVANVYLGEIRPEDLQFADVWDAYCRLTESSDKVDKTIDRAKLRRQFKKLPVIDPQTLTYSIQFVHSLAELISQRATRQATVIVSLETENEVGTTLNLHSALSTYLKHAMNLLNADTGTILLFNPEDNRLEPYAQFWGEHEDLCFWTALADDRGLTALCARENLKHYRRTAEEPVKYSSYTTSDATVIRLNSRAGMDRKCQESHVGSRSARELESIMIAPILCGDLFLGTLDIGSRRRAAFRADDENVLLLFARQVGLHVNSVRERRRLLNVFGEHNATDLARVIADQIPLDVGGKYCSIFVKRTPREAVLYATNELTLRNYKGEQPSYMDGEGLTGWILENGEPLLIPGGPKCRTDNLPADLRSRGVEWKAKHRDQDERGKDYYEDAAYVGVPMVTAGGKVCGVIRVSECNRGSFTEDDVKCLRAHADALAFLLDLPEEVTGVPVAPRKVFLGYGQDRNAAACVRQFLQSEGIIVHRYDEQAKAGKYPRDIVFECIRECHAAVIVVTGDDELKSGERVARRNVAYELGMAHSHYGPMKTFVVQQRGTEECTNVKGMQVIYFDKNRTEECLKELRKFMVRGGVLRA